MLEEKKCCGCSTPVYEPKTHWENAYNAREENQLGWYQTKATQSLQMIEKSELAKDALIADIGSGSSVFIDNLLNAGYTNLLATDIAKKALNDTQKRIGKDNAAKVNWIFDNLLAPTKLNNISNIDLWHDRAVFHFFTDKKDRDIYFNLMDKAVKKSGFVMIATFYITGKEKCCDLTIRRYDEEKLSKFLGNGYQLIHSFQHDYINPKKEKRPYIYTLFKKL